MAVSDWGGRGCARSSRNSIGVCLGFTLGALATDGNHFWTRAGVAIDES